MTASVGLGVYPEVLTTVAPHRWPEITRVAMLHRCQSLVLGFRHISEPDELSGINKLISRVDCDVILLRAGANWPPPAGAKRILVPVGGSGGHDELLARLLGSLVRTAQRDVKFLRVLPENSAEKMVNKARRDLARTARDNAMTHAEIEVLQARSACEVIAEQANDRDLTILGLQRVSRRVKLLGGFSLDLARATDCPLILISPRG